jgi:hypothetical protein
MLRYVSVLIGLAVLAGCQTSGKSELGSKKGESPTKLAAFGGSSQYPRDMQVTRDLPLTVMINRDRKSLRLINPTDQNLQDLKIWVNGEYVQPVDSMPAHSIVHLRYDNFYNNTGRTLTVDKVGVDRVELQTGDKLHFINGPVWE